MSDTPVKPTAAVIVGLGVTGLSCARYLLARGWRVCVTDSRADPPGRAQLAMLDADITVRFGFLDTSLLDEAVCVIASPGVPLSDPFFAEARRRGITIAGDIELFAVAADAPVVGITGTNGKSTVTTLLGRMAERAGMRVRVGGNLGDPALDLLRAAQADAQPTELYVLELSSYQLEATTSLDLRAATVLNVTPDHLDRYASMAEYAAAKARIFGRCDTAVINLDDPLVAAMPHQAARVVGFSLRDAPGADYTVAVREAGKPWLMRRGEPLIAMESMRLAGMHNAANALAALALGEAIGLPLPVMPTTGASAATANNSISPAIVMPRRRASAKKGSDSGTPGDAITHTASSSRLVSRKPKRTVISASSMASWARPGGSARLSVTHTRQPRASK